MIQLLMIADDFTGALDTGVQFAAKGANVRVVTVADYDMKAVDDDVQVLVFDAETRHMTAKAAYDTVYGIVKQAADLKVPYIFKKTDSALRGNIGAELAAVLDATGEKTLPFLPAFPQIGRNTVAGIHYINEKPVAESVFGIDPFEPVKESYVPKMIGLQTSKTAISAAAVHDGEVPQVEGIVVFDAQSAEDLYDTAKALKAADKLHIMAGCAGFGAVIPELLGLSKEEKPAMPKLDKGLMMLCGSVNPITVAQVKTADENGFAHIRMTPAQKLTPGYFTTNEGKALIAEWNQILTEHPYCVIDTNDEDGNGPTSEYARENGLTIEDVRVGISGALGLIMGELFDSPALGTLLVTGGDTLLQVMNRMGVYELIPIGEVYSGAVLSRFSYKNCSRFVISKSGGFGKPTLLCDLREMIETMNA